MDVSTAEIDLTVTRAPFWRGLGWLQVRARQAGRRVGGADLAPTRQRAEAPVTWWLVNLRVHRRHRRQGIGREIVRRCVEVARERGVSRLCAAVDRRNGPSLALFASVGFRPMADPALRRQAVWIHWLLWPWSWGRLVVLGRDPSADEQTNPGRE